MKYLIIIFNVILIFGCETTPNSIGLFEKSLPEKDLAVLNSLVDSYESFLLENYPGKSKNKNTRTFLESILKDELGNLNLRQSNFCSVLKSLENSDLIYTSEELPYDTTYYLRSSQEIVGRRRSGELDTILMIFPPDVSNELNYIKEKGYIELIGRNNFIESLELIRSYDDKISEYVEVKKETGELESRELARTILELEDITYQNYFMKRIIVMELFINGYKKHYSC